METPRTPDTSFTASDTSSSWDANTPSYSKPTFKVISIEGNIGSGKSTLLANLKEYFKGDENVIFLKEPVDEWETVVDADGKAMLQKFYADPAKYAFPFQMMAYISRLAVLKAAIKENPHATIISERSLYTDKFVFAKMLYDMGKIEDVCYQIYNRWFDVFAAECPIEQLIYVCTDPAICHARTKKRARVGEEGIPLDYLKECHIYHEKMIRNDIQDYIPSEQLVLDGNVDIFENTEKLAEWKKLVTQFIGARMPRLDEMTLASVSF